ncbi:retrovirus-related pol polyprotein from transposon TNT 1-94, partial [Tanacetum coccineum]
QSQEQLNNDNIWKQKESNSFRELNVKYFEIQDLKAQLQDKDIAISEFKKLIEKLKGKSMETKFEKPSITITIVSKDFSKPVTAQILPQNKNTVQKNTNVIAPGMYKVHTKPNQTRTLQLPQDFRKTNKRVSFSIGVIPTTSFSRPQLKSNQLGDRVMPNNSQGKMQEVEDHHWNFKFYKNKMSVTACNDSLNAKTSHLVKIILFIIDYGCSKHMTRNLKLLSNFVEKFLGTVKFGNDQIASILGYGDLVQGNVAIKRFYYVKGLNHNLFFVGQFCDADLEVAFRKSTCYIHDLKGNDLLTGSRGTYLYSITFQDTSTPNPICLMAKATSSQEWLWHRHLSYLNFDSINLLSKNDIVIGLPKLKFIKDHLCSSCELGKAKQKSFHTNTTPSSWLQILHMDLCGPIRRKHLTTSSLADNRLSKFFNILVLSLLTSSEIVRKSSRDGENLGKMKEKGDACIFVGYSTQSRAYRVYNKRTRVIVETIHVNFDELPQMASDHLSSDPVPQCPTMALEQGSLSPGLQSQAPTQVPTVTATENIIQAETNNEYAQVDDDEFVNVFSTPVQERGETSIRRQLETDGKFCMFALTVSRTEPKNIKEAMADSAWMEAM